MADFLSAFSITMQTEGGYNPGDGEAETYMGVDRSQNEGWGGWPVIDGIKTENPGAGAAALNAIFAANEQLQTNIQQFYKTGYWNPLGLDSVTNQQVANALFDCSVNPCIITASYAAQMACIAVRQNAISVDGAVGPKTLACINSLSPELFIAAFNGVRIANYYERVRLTPIEKQWLSSWLGRCKPFAQVPESAAVAMDARSLTNLNTLHPRFKQSAIAAWAAAQAAMPANTKIIVIQGLRSFAESDALFKLGRTVANPDGKSAKKPMGNIVTNAAAGQSYHNYGLAFDFAMVTNGKNDNTVGPNWLKVVSVMGEHGISWGGNFATFKDEPHFENRFGHNWKDLLALHNAGTFLPGGTYIDF